VPDARDCRRERWLLIAEVTRSRQIMALLVLRLVDQEGVHQYGAVGGAYQTSPGTHLVERAGLAAYHSPPSQAPVIVVGALLRDAQTEDVRPGSKDSEQRLAPDSEGNAARRATTCGLRASPSTPFYALAQPGRGRH
jgi:hypothetical protein